MQTSPFLVQAKVPIRFSDVDAMGHVNNARYITFMEEARVIYFQKLLPETSLSDPHAAFPVIIADIQCALKAPLYCGETVVIALGVTAIGTKSFHLGYELWEENSERLVATANTVQVMYDYETKQSCRMSAEFRARIERLEQKKF